MVEAFILMKNKKRNDYSFKCLLFILSYFIILTVCWTWRWILHVNNITPVVTTSAKCALKIVFHGFLEQLGFAQHKVEKPLALIWVGFLGVRFDSLELGYKLQIWHVSTHTYVASENIPFINKALLILLMSAFLYKKSPFFGKNSTFTILWELCLRFFNFVFSCCKMKGYY